MGKNNLYNQAQLGNYFCYFSSPEKPQNETVVWLECLSQQTFGYAISVAAYLDPFTFHNGTIVAKVHRRCGYRDPEILASKWNHHFPYLLVQVIHCWRSCLSIPAVDDQELILHLTINVMTMAFGLEFHSSLGNRADHCWTHHLSARDEC